MTTPIEISAEAVKLVTRLAMLKENRAKQNATGGNLNTAKRLHAQGSLLAVIEFLNSVPEWRQASLAVGLHDLEIALADIDQGRRVPWLHNGMSHPQPPVAMRALRGRCAGVMDVLMNKAGIRLSEAAATVARTLSPEAQKALAAVSNGKPVTAAMVEDWREKAVKGGSAESEGMDAIRSIAETYSGSWSDFASKVLRSIDRQAIALSSQ